MTHKLLIVDDELPNLRLLTRLFRQDFTCLTASSGEEAIELLSQHDVAIVITDQRMPQMSGIELLKQTAEMRPHMARILLTGYTDVEALVEAINCGLVHRYITKPWNNEDLKQKVNRALEEYENNKKRHALKVANDRLEVRLNEMKRGVANALDALLRVKDEYSSEHSARVADLSAKIAEHIEMRDEEREDLFLAAIVHRIGHIGTPDELLWKTNCHDDVEAACYHEHCERGARMLSMIPELRNVADIVLLHHENFDGSGYPRQLQGEQIPLACRILRVADEFDLLTQPRSHSAGVSNESALESLRERSGADFDPRVIEVMVRLNSGHNITVIDDGEFRIEAALTQRESALSDTSPGLV
ncbi:MAG TPA: HD domain-containing phosphohydrolase [Pyrinomonadaceae bacterium]|nr:HD domain-containing phosphohydrolase [Pyrinomonadaceae bacterium]